MSDFISPHHLLLRALKRRRVDFVVIGVSVINYYARDTREIISTGDYDIFIRSGVVNVERALEVLLKEGCSVSYKPRGIEELVPVRRSGLEVCRKIVQDKSVVIAVGPYESVFELVQMISGFTFEEIKRRSVKMRDWKLRTTFPVGRLEDLLESKRVANREKDRLFLQKYKDILLRPPWQT